jgi:hypothetical protein
MKIFYEQEKNDIIEDYLNQINKINHSNKLDLQK